jgi:hypothetical protein
MVSLTFLSLLSLLTSATAFMVQHSTGAPFMPRVPPAAQQHTQPAGFPRVAFLPRVPAPKHGDSTSMNMSELPTSLVADSLRVVDALLPTAIFLGSAFLSIKQAEINDPEPIATVVVVEPQQAKVAYKPVAYKKPPAPTVMTASEKERLLEMAATYERRAVEYKAAKYGVVTAVKKESIVSKVFKFFFRGSSKLSA